jgi:hypothetical protein
MHFALRGISRGDMHTLKKNRRKKGAANSRHIAAPDSALYRSTAKSVAQEASPAAR